MRSPLIIFLLFLPCAAAQAADDMVVVSGSLAKGIDAFRLDRTPATVASFRRFVRDTAHRTTAEQLGSSLVMTFGTGEWKAVEGADWRHPTGPGGDSAIPDHPVTHVSWHDARAFCEWKGKRLPTDAEWLHAADLSRSNEGERAHANTWTGTFPMLNDASDGFKTTSPVGHYGESAIGLADMVGNVWEWTDGETRGEKNQRGGSFLCDEKVCAGFRHGSLGHAPPDSSHIHVGFRCANDDSATHAESR